VSWKVVALGDVCDFQNGFAFKSNLFSERGLPILRISNIQNQIIDTSNLVYFHKKSYKENLDKYMVHPNDLLIAMSGATTGKIGFNNTDKIFYLNQRVGNLKPKAHLDKKFLYYFLSTQVQKNLSISAGAAQPNLSTEQIKQILIPLPSLVTQQKTVERLDAIFTEIDKAVTAVEDNIKNADALFQSYLTEVFDTNNDVVNKKLDDIVLRLTNGYVGATKDIYRDDGIPYLLARHVKNNVLTFDKLTYVDEAFNNKNKKSMLKYDDVLLVQSGHIGHSAVVPRQHEGHNCHAMIVITTKKEILSGEYLSLYFQTNLMKNQFEMMKTGSTIKHLNCGTVKLLNIPVPAIKKQDLIVARAKEFKMLKDISLVAYSKKISSLNALKESVLKQAFNGELVRE
jgi:type I restriction enzyme S subunit